MDDSESPKPFDTRELLRDVALFRHLDAAAFAELEAELEWFACPAAPCCSSSARHPTRSTCSSPAVSARSSRTPAAASCYGMVDAGETVGELGLIVDQPRSATVRALRDSELLRLSRRGFMAW